MKLVIFYFVACSCMEKKLALLKSLILLRESLSPQWGGCPETGVRCRRCTDHCNSMAEMSFFFCIRHNHSLCPSINSPFRFS